MHRADSADGSVHVYAKLAQAYARTAYACFDQPDLKAVFTFQVTAPAHWSVLSNQPLDHCERTGGGFQTCRFLPTARLPTFTTTVVAGDYHVVTASHTTPGGQRIPLELACRAGLADRLSRRPPYLRGHCICRLRRFPLVGRRSCRSYHTCLWCCEPR